MNSTDSISLAGNNEYAKLKRLIKQKGLLNKTPFYYFHKLTVSLALLGLSIALLSVIDTTWLHLLNAVFLAFVFGQLGFIGHDAGHQQVFRGVRRNDMLGLGFNLLLGVSRGWWADKHNRHHSNPNDADLDPDVDFPILAFSEEQAYSKQGIARFVVKYQAFILFPLMLLEALNMRYSSIVFMVRNGRKARYVYIESIFMVLHLVLYVAFLSYLLGPWQAALFALVHQALFGLYMGLSFAPNHKGMPMVDGGSDIDFLRRQVITARNLRPNRVIDFVFGALACQIEHHLFPTMSRRNLREAQKVIKAFCQERSISYYETGILQSYGEVLQHLHAVGAQLRAPHDTPRKSPQWHPERK